MMHEMFKFDLAGDTHDVIEDSWQLAIPTKTVVFFWRIFLGKLPTRDMLQMRGILVDDQDVYHPLCFHENETSSYLFFIARWLNLFGRRCSDG